MISLEQNSVDELLNIKNPAQKYFLDTIIEFPVLATTLAFNSDFDTREKPYTLNENDINIIAKQASYLLYFHAIREKKKEFINIREDDPKKLFEAIFTKKIYGVNAPPFEKKRYQLSAIHRELKRFEGLHVFEYTLYMPEIFKINVFGEINFYR
jgi:hypothetical protein